jgi:DNA-binding CsgD family transcriptional regulator
MLLDEVLFVRCSSRMKRDVLDAAGDAGVSEYGREAITEKLRRPAMTEAHRYAEVVLVPRAGSSSSLDDLLELAAARSPMVCDFISGDGHLDQKVRAKLRASLSPVQARRIERALRGMSYEDIAQLEGCSKQAVWASFRRALLVLEQDTSVLRSLCELYEESGLDPTVVLEAFNARHAASP